jgi:hypothetical protein
MAEDDEKNRNLEISPAPSGGHVKWRVAALETIVATLVVAVLLKLLSNSGHKYETNWILISILPVLFYLFFSGRLASFKAFGVELKTAIQRASNQKITIDQEIDYEAVNPEPKEDESLIPKYINQRVSAISFRLGQRDYYTVSAIKQYLQRLLCYPFLRYVVFVRGHEFGALIRARDLYLFGIIGEGEDSGFQRIKKAIEDDDVRSVPGIVEAMVALKTTNTRRQALERFESTGVDELPVIASDGKLLGTVNRGKLQSEVLASIVRAAAEDS